jgi:GT2 family glycosyltransferase
MTENVPVDIILPVAENYHHTSRCIDSIFKNTRTLFRLIIVDNGIKEKKLSDYLSGLAAGNENIRLIAKDKVTGFAASVNKGIEAAGSAIVAVVTTDVVVSENWLEKMREGFKVNQNTGIVAAKCNYKLIKQFNVSFNPEQDIDAQLHRINLLYGASRQPDFSMVPFVPGFCLLIKKELVEKFGGFDTIYGDSIYFADFDLCFRAGKEFTTLVSNKTVVYHNDSTGSGEARIPLNYTIFRKKWLNHPYFEFLPPDMFPQTRLNILQQDQENFYFKENLKEDHKRYLLINPPIVDTKDFWHGYQITPVGILRVAHYLINQGDKINFFNFDPYNDQYPRQKLDVVSKKEMFVYGKTLDQLSEYIKDLKDIDEVLITTTITFHHPNFFMKMLVERIREVYGDIKITIGGLYASLCADEVKKLGVEVHVGPYYSADSLRPLSEITEEKESVIMRVVKGCPRTCSYCVVPGLEGRNLTHYQKEHIINHFQEYFSLGYTNYKFWDSNILFGKENLFMLLDYLNDYGYNSSVSIDFSYGLEFALIDEEFIQKLKRVNLRNSLFVPLESSEYEMYKDKFHRPSTHLGFITKAVQKLQEAEFKHMCFYVMAGLPYQTLDQVLKTLIFGWRLNLFPAIMLYTPIPGTEDYTTYLDFYRDKEYWELNPYLFPGESEELTAETLAYLEKFNYTYLRYSEAEGYYFEKPKVLKQDGKWGYQDRFKVNFEDNKIFRRLKELINEEDIRPEELDERTFRVFHAINL